MAGLFALDLFATGLFDPGLFEQEGTVPDIVSTGAAVATQNVPYSFQIEATGDLPMTWSLTVGTLPTGLTLGAATGIVSGTPTVVESKTVTVRALNAHGNDTQVLIFNVVAASSGGNDILPVPTNKGKGILRSPLKSPIGF